MNTIPSAFEDAPPVRFNEDGSQTYGPYVTHPDITDRFGRVWVWKDRDLYVHDGLIAIPEDFIRHKDMQLPNRKLKGNLNYAGLCEICTSEW